MHNCVRARVCVWCFEARQQSGSSRSIQSARRRPVIPTTWWKTEKLKCYTHTHTHAPAPTHTKIRSLCVLVFIFFAFGVASYPGCFWHVINACDIRAQTEFSRKVLFSYFAPNENRIFLPTRSIAQLAQSMPHGRPGAGCCAPAQLDLCFWANYYKLPLKEVLFSTDEGTFFFFCFLISFSQLW